MNNAQRNLAALAANPYPGRGIVMGKSADGKLILQVYWLMGRSENSRNRLLVREGETVKTVPYDEAKVEDPSLIIYNAMRVVKTPAGVYHIVSNGDQTDTIAKYLERGETFENAIRGRTYEPDAPNFTSRISAAIHADGQDSITSIIRRDPATGEPRHDFFKTPLVNGGLGMCIHTYHRDDDPLPPFHGAPYEVPLAEGVEDTARMYWDSLNPQNRIAIVVKSIDIRSEAIDYCIINRLAESESKTD